MIVTNLTSLRSNDMPKCVASRFLLNGISLCTFEKFTDKTSQYDRHRLYLQYKKANGFTLVNCSFVRVSPTAAL